MKGVSFYIWYGGGGYPYNIEKVLQHTDTNTANKNNTHFLPPKAIMES